MITGAMLYDCIKCPHRPLMDIYGDPTKRDKLSPFVQLLWEKGTAYEEELISKLDIPFLDLSIYSEEEKEQKTREAIEQKISLIYSGRISSGDLVGIPDLLRLEEGGYVAGDIKSGSGEEGQDDNRRPKKEYAVQLALYTEILNEIGVSQARHAFVWDINSKEIIYEFDEEFGKRDPTTLWNIYEKTLNELRTSIEDNSISSPAYSSICKLCHWRSECMNVLIENNDLTLIPELGRSNRDALQTRLNNIQELAQSDIESFLNGQRTVFPGIGIKTLEKFKRRADLISDPNGKPYLISPVVFPKCETELFFDIEVDSMQNFCYLHGFVLRRNKITEQEQYHAFYADDLSADAEKEAFKKAWGFVSEHQPCVIYYYSKYERTIWRKLQTLYPEVCSENDIENMFNPEICIDLLYDVVTKNSVWPTKDHSIKSLAQYLGFSWRDSDPSGAASVEWFQRFLEEKDPEIKKRILEYNEDDCIAMRVLLDALEKTPVRAV